MHTVDQPLIRRIGVVQAHAAVVLAVGEEADAGHIGKYDCCIAVTKVTGSWRPLAGASPYKGIPGKLCECEELKVEVTVKAKNLHRTIESIKRIHPYEEPVVNVIPLWGTGLSHPGN